MIRYSMWKGRNVVRAKAFWSQPDLVAKIIAESKSMKEVAAKLDIAYGSRVTAKLHRYAEENGILVDFGLERYHRKSGRIPDELVFVENSTYLNNHVELKARFIQFTGVDYKCVICGQDGFWHGAPLVLQLDHINGVNTDHRVENLRLLCPNCHTQTETYAGRRFGYATFCKRGHIFDEENTLRHASGKRKCRQCQLDGAKRRKGDEEALRSRFKNLEQ